MNYLPYHHVFWKTPFQMVRDQSIVESDKNLAVQAIQKFDSAVNRFDLPDDDQTAGAQGKAAIIEAPYFEILTYSLKFLRQGKIKVQKIDKAELQSFIHDCPPRINQALKALEKFEGKPFITALRNHILQLIPQIINGKIPEGFTAMIDYRYKNVKVKDKKNKQIEFTPEDPSAQFNNLRTAIKHLCLPWCYGV